MLWLRANRCVTQLEQVTAAGVYWQRCLDTPDKVYTPWLLGCTHPVHTCLDIRQPMVTVRHFIMPHASGQPKHVHIKYTLHWQLDSSLPTHLLCWGRIKAAYACTFTPVNGHLCGRARPSAAHRRDDTRPCTAYREITAVRDQIHTLTHLVRPQTGDWQRGPQPRSTNTSPLLHAYSPSHACRSRDCRVTALPTVAVRLLQHTRRPPRMAYKTLCSAAPLSRAQHST